MSIDDLLSGEELVLAAEQDGMARTEKLLSRVFGMLDVMLVLLVFLPLFGQKGTGEILHVSLIGLSGTTAYIKAAYIGAVVISAVLGIIQLAMQSEGPKINRTLSLVLSVFTTLLFMATMQPYAAAFVFFGLIIKGIMLVKRQ